MLILVPVITSDPASIPKTVQGIVSKQKLFKKVCSDF
jgi:hypothetical protein